jgi:hypothetical protein
LITGQLPDPSFIVDDRWPAVTAILTGWGRLVKSILPALTESRRLDKGATNGLSNRFLAR